MHWTGYDDFTLAQEIYTSHKANIAMHWMNEINDEIIQQAAVFSDFN